ARGCHFNCAFCYDAKGHQGVRPLPFERLRRELQLFVEQRVAQIWILDSTFNAPPGRGEKLLELLLETAPQIHYHIEAKADFLDDEIIALLAQLSCSVQIGLQSADPEVLIPLRRKLNKKLLEQNLHKLSQAGVTFGLDLIYGLPGDNHSGFQKSLDFALDQQPNQIDIFPLSVLPGTELFENQGSFNIQGEKAPPYNIKSNQSYSAADMQQSCQLAAATDIFYNRGRAVGFFLQLCHALKLTSVDFLTRFSEWVIARKNLNEQQLLAVEDWQPKAILPLQIKFATEQLQGRNKAKLVPLAEDLIHYHYHCAEVLLADECRPGGNLPAEKAYMESRWKLNPALQMQKFHFALDDLEIWGGESLENIYKNLTPNPGQTIFLRQRGKILIETLDEDFALLLARAKKAELGAQLIAGFENHSAMELLQSAVGQGLLLPAA
ncbi:MAG: radical SAM protein, partial [Deltaproteobacteria bacterium]|nr:radical SAM protein [Deltaproteobacteria bacterium]